MRQPSGEHATVRFVEREPSARHRRQGLASPRIVSGTIELEPRGYLDDELLAGEAEQVICSCRAHGTPS